MGAEIPVLDKGFVRLDASMADDLSVVNAARVSFAKRSDYEVVEEYDPDGRPPVAISELRLKDEDAGLIRFLLTNRHGTPFEHNAFRFHVKCPIFVAREWMRHRIGSFNEMSGRYTKLEAEFYVPPSQNVRTQVGKPGAYVFNVIEEQTAAAFADALEVSQREAFFYYEKALKEGVAKELARLFLPVSIYTEFYWTTNLRSIMNFLSLRNAPTAMFEIRQYAQVVEQLVGECMPVSMQAFVENGRVAP